MHMALPRVLSVNAGFMDAAAYLALKGLFTAHVTGNFVALGAALVSGTSGTLAKVLALPVFCVVVIGVRLFSYGLRARSLPVAGTLLGAQLALTVLARFCDVIRSLRQRGRVRGARYRNDSSRGDGDSKCRPSSPFRQRASFDDHDGYDDAAHDGFRRRHTRFGA